MKTAMDITRMNLAGIAVTGVVLRVPSNRCLLLMRWSRLYELEDCDSAAKESADARSKQSEEGTVIPGVCL